MISVCMATYNGEKFIRRQLETILSQLAKDDEVVISDDGSTDKTLEEVAALHDKRIKVLHHKSCGFPYNFENALMAAMGDVIFLSDQDDEWSANRVNLVMRTMTSGNDLVCVDAVIVNENGTVIGDSFFAMNGKRYGLLRNLLKNSFLGCCMAFRREILTYALPFPRRLYMHDWWIALVSMMFGFKYCYLEEPLHHYRKHGNNLTVSGNKSANPYWLRIYLRLILVGQLAYRYLKKKI